MVVPRGGEKHATKTAEKHDSKVEVEENVANVARPPVTPSLLKVAELREELSVRGMSSKGLKRELVERLEAAIAQGQSTEECTTSSQPAGAIDGGEEEDRENPQDDTLTDSAKASSPIKTPSKKRARREKEKAIQPMEEEEQVDYTMSPKESPSESPKRPIQEDDPANLPVEVSLQEAKVYAADGDSSQTVPFPPHPPTTTAPSTILHITNFVRPLTVAAVKELIGQFGKVDDFWMDAIKSHCFVLYAEGHAADECHRKLDGLRWPMETGRNLQVKFSTLEEMQAAKIPSLQGKDERETSDHKQGPEHEHHHVDPSIKSPPPPVEEAKSKDAPLDQLFLKTQSIPQLYYLPAIPLDRQS